MHALTFAGRITCSLAFMALISLGACHSGGSSSETPVPFSAKLVKAADPGDLENRIKAELTRRYDRIYDYYTYGGIAVAGNVGGALPQTGGNQTSTSTDTGTLPHSETNIQESGVDEGDLIKTDGAFIYLARGSHFFILKATPASETTIVSDIDLGEPVNELHLAGSRVFVITTPLFTSPSATVSIASSIVATVQSITRVYDYDVSAPAQPVLTARYDFPGSLQGSRRINNTIYLVTNYSIDLPAPVTPWDYLSTGISFDSACAQARQENLNRIEALTLDDLLPPLTATLFSAGMGTSSTSPVIAPGDVYIPEFGNGTDLALVISLDLAGAEPLVSASGVMSSWCTIYMTTDSLYLASGNAWQWIMPLSGEGMPQGNPEPRTAVHKFSLSGGAGKPLYTGSGVVDGWINDRFSMGDYLGYLRIGTTRGGWWGEDISNQLAVLSQESGALIETGKITGLAPGERIYSMRFDRDRGYMVTFRQTDPLYTFDLSDPGNPRIAGELTVHGFATYIHLLGAETAPRLLTIGRSADSTGRVTGNKLQLFDVSSLAAPQLLGDYELGAGWSDALYDPHAFLYYEPLGILTVPYYAFGSTGAYSSGLNVFNIGPASISLRGIIHAGMLTSGYGTYEDTVDRSVIIGSSIYAVAHRSVIVAGADQLDVVAAVDLPESYPNYPLIVAGDVATTSGKK
jgi:uncharacterized secreted protein with C-terminal beta-propeller domain